MKINWGLVGYLLFFLIGMLAQGAHASVTYTPDTMTTCNGSTCNLVIYSGIMNYWNGTGYTPINTTINTSYNTGGYDYAMVKSDYHLYIKAHSNWGDGVKYCVNDSGTEYCLTYQGQDYSYRDVYGSQDYISSISDVAGVVVGNNVMYPDVFPYVNLSYSTRNAMIKEDYAVKQLPRAPAGYLTPPITLDFGGYVKYPGLVMQVNGVNMSGDFTTQEQIDFVHEGKVLFYLPKPYAHDSNNSYNAIHMSNMKYQLLTYEVKTQGSQIWFYVRTPYTWLSNSSIVYPIFIDPTITINDTSNGILGDARVAAAASSTNFGTETTVYTQACPVGGGDAQRGYFMFNLTSIPADATITNANLSLYVEGTSGSVYSWSVFNTSGTWKESTLTWTNAPAAVTVQGGAFTTSGSKIWSSWNVTNATNTWWIQSANPTKNVSFQVRYTTEGGTCASETYTSKENTTDTTKRPQLNITYTAAEGGAIIPSSDIGDPLYCSIPPLVPSGISIPIMCMPKSNTTGQPLTGLTVTCSAYSSPLFASAVQAASSATEQGTGGMYNWTLQTGNIVPNTCYIINCSTLVNTVTNWFGGTLCVMPDMASATNMSQLLAMQQSGNSNITTVNTNILAVGSNLTNVNSTLVSLMNQLGVNLSSVNNSILQVGINLTNVNSTLVILGVNVTNVNSTQNSNHGLQNVNRTQLNTTVVAGFANLTYFNQSTNNTLNRLANNISIFNTTTNATLNALASNVSQLTVMQQSANSNLTALVTMQQSANGNITTINTNLNGLIAMQQSGNANITSLTVMQQSGNSNITIGFSGTALNLSNINTTLIILGINLTGVNTTVILIGSNLTSVNTTQNTNYGNQNANLTNLNTTVIAGFTNLSMFNTSTNATLIALGVNITSSNNTGAGGGLTAQNVWEYATRILTDYNQTSINNTLTALGNNITSVNNTGGAGTTAQQVWEYGTRILTDYNQTSSNATLLSIQDLIDSLANLTDAQVWNYASRMLTDYNMTSLNASQASQTSTLNTINSNTATIPADVWGYGTRTLTSSSCPATSDIWTYSSRTLTDYNMTSLNASQTSQSSTIGTINTNTATIPSDVWGYSPRTLTSFGTLLSDIWGYSTRTLTDYNQTSMNSTLTRLGMNITSVNDTIKSLANANVTLTNTTLNVTYYDITNATVVNTTVNVSTNTSIASQTNAITINNSDTSQLIGVLVAAILSLLFAYTSAHSEQQFWKGGLFILSLGLMYLTVVLAIQALAVSGQNVVSTTSTGNGTIDYLYGNTTDTEPQQNLLKITLNPIWWIIALMLFLTLLELTINILNTIFGGKKGRDGERR
jgi:hypothetical protein